MFLYSSGRDHVRVTKSKLLISLISFDMSSMRQGVFRQGFHEGVMFSIFLPRKWTGDANSWSLTTLTGPSRLTRCTSARAFTGTWQRFCHWTASIRMAASNSGRNKSTKQNWGWSNTVSHTARNATSSENLLDRLIWTLVVYLVPTFQKRAKGRSGRAKRVRFSPATPSFTLRGKHHFSSSRMCRTGFQLPAPCFG